LIRHERRVRGKEVCQQRGLEIDDEISRCRRSTNNTLPGGSSLRRRSVRSGGSSFLLSGLTAPHAASATAGRPARGTAYYAGMVARYSFRHNPTVLTSP